jgi:outer membrane protein TolC
LAVAQGNLPLSSAAADLAPLADLDKTIDDLDRQQQARRHDLNALLGLEPEVELRLAPHIRLPVVERSAIEQELPKLPNRRPDLVALRLGYAAQEEKLRGAILGQFPALVLGGIGGTDTTPVGSVGPSITPNLPVFNHNEGNIAIEQATRQKVHNEYTAWLTTTVSEVETLLAAQSLLRRLCPRFARALHFRKAQADAIGTTVGAQPSAVVGTSALAYSLQKSKLPANRRQSPEGMLPLLR